MEVVVVGTVVVGAAVVVGGAVVVAATVVVVGATVVVDSAVVVGAAVVAGTTVVVAATVVVGAAVVVEAGTAVSELPPHPETTNKNVTATAYFLTASVCHPSPQGGVGATSEPPGVDTRSRQATAANRRRSSRCS